MSACDNIPDDILELVLEGRKFDAVSALRNRIGCGLAVAKSYIEAAEDELGMMEMVDCTTCQATGKMRAYKPEYDPAKRFKESR